MTGNVGRGFEYGYGAYFGRAAARATVWGVAAGLDTLGRRPTWEYREAGGQRLALRKAVDSDGYAVFTLYLMVGKGKRDKQPLDSWDSHDDIVRVERRDGSPTTDSDWSWARFSGGQVVSSIFGHPVVPDYSLIVTRRFDEWVRYIDAGGTLKSAHEWREGHQDWLRRIDAWIQTHPQEEQTPEMLRAAYLEWRTSVREAAVKMPPLHRYAAEIDQVARKLGWHRMWKCSGHRWTEGSPWPRSLPAGLYCAAEFETREEVMAHQAENCVGQDVSIINPKGSLESIYPMV